MPKANKPIDGQLAIRTIKRPANTGMKRPAAQPEYTDFNKAVIVKRPSGAIIAHAWTRRGLSPQTSQR